MLAKQDGALGEPEVVPDRRMGSVRLGQSSPRANGASGQVRGETARGARLAHRGGWRGEIPTSCLEEFLQRVLNGGRSARCAVDAAQLPIVDRSA